jgi:paraquat-inducible protein A
MNGIPDGMRYAISSQTIISHLRRAARLIAHWHVPAVLIAAAACLIAGVRLPILVVREFFVYGQKLSILDGVNALLGEGDWPLAMILVLFSIAVPLGKIGALLVLWWQRKHGRLPPSWRLGCLEWSGRWAMLDVFVVALVIVLMKAHTFFDAHIAGAVYPFIAAVGLSMPLARFRSTARRRQLIWRQRGPQTGADGQFTLCGPAGSFSTIASIACAV